MVDLAHYNISGSLGTHRGNVELTAKVYNEVYTWVSLFVDHIHAPNVELLNDLHSTHRA